MASDGAILAKRCAACHGVNFEKAPLGRENHIAKGNSKEQAIRKIKYYQHAKDADELIMKAQVKNLTPSQINALAEYISTRK